VDGDHAVCATNPKKFLTALLAALHNVAGRSVTSSVCARDLEPLAA
jgi:hypothetical protein